MADQLLRCKPAKRGDETLLDIEALAARGKWRRIMTIKPDVRFSVKDTLSLDIFASSIGWQDCKSTRKQVVATGADGTNRLVTEVSVHSHDMLRVETRVTFRRQMRVEMARDMMTLDHFPVDHAWSPHQTPQPDMVIGDFAFRSPAVLVQSKDQCVAVLPNLRFMASDRDAPVAMTFNPANAEISCGVIPYRLVHSTYCAHSDDDTVDLGGVATYSYFIHYQKGCKTREGMRRVAHRLWRLYAETRVLAVAPQSIPFDTYAARVATAEGAILSMRDAFGLALHEQRTKDKAAMKRAAAFREQILSLPQHDGLFALPSAFGPPEKDSLLRLADLSWTCYWLVRWHQEIEKDERTLAFVKAYAARLVTLQKHGGHVPAWVDAKTGASHRFCAKSAESAAHAVLMGVLHTLDPREEYLSCARRAVNFAIRTIARHGRWENTEAFHTTSPQWKEKKPLRADAVQGRHTAHVLALWTVAEALIRLFEATGTERYHWEGQRVLDELSLYQQLWDPPFIGVPCFGGFGAMNTDLQWNDAAQALIAKTYLDYYRACGLTEYFQRGVAALRAAWSMVRCAENPAIEALMGDAQIADPLLPFVSPTKPLAPVTVPGTVAASGVTALSLLCIGELVRREYGDVYVDTRRQQAFGVNGVVVDRMQQDLAGLAVYGREALGQDRTLTVRLDTGHAFTLKVKGGAAFETQA